MHEPGFAFQPGDTYRRATVVEATKFYPRLGLNAADGPAVSKQAGPDLDGTHHDTGRHLLLLSVDGGFIHLAADHQFKHNDNTPADLLRKPAPRLIAEATYRDAVARYAADPRWQAA